MLGAIFDKWWSQSESNQRHKDFQSFALPTELTGLVSQQKLFYTICLLMSILKSRKNWIVTINKKCSIKNYIK